MFLRSNRVIPAPLGLTWHYQLWFRGVPVAPGVLVGEGAGSLGFDLMDASGELVATVWQAHDQVVSWYIHLVDALDDPADPFMFADDAVGHANRLVCDLRNLPIS